MKQNNNIFDIFVRLNKTAGYIFILGALLASTTILLPAPAQAGRMIWSTVDTPGSAFNVIVSPSEINFLQVCQDGRTIYATDTANSKLYRSDDAGASWFDLTGNLIRAGAALPAWMITTAPDNPQFVAVATGAISPSNVFISADAGQNWSNSNMPPAPGPISALAVSPFNNFYDIAVGIRALGSGGIYIFKAMGISGNWADQAFNGDVLALRFSPGYQSDQSLAVLYSTVTGTYFNVGVHDTNANTTGWANIYSGSVPEITATGPGTSPKANQVIVGDLELPSDFSGQAPSMCRAYASIDAIGGSAGIFRIDGNLVFQLMNAQPNKRISSIAYQGTYTSGKLLAGEVTGNATQASVMTWFTDAPMTCPATCWYQAEKPASGGGTSGYGNAQVAWATGGRAYCGTSSAPLSGPGAWPSAYLNGTPLDESALSFSIDSGKTWNQLSLIDTQINYLSDVAVSMDSNTLYLSTINNAASGFDSIWRSAGQVSGKSWERVLCFSSPTNDVILRMNNAVNDRSIFFASRGTADLRQSNDNGQTWKPLLPGMALLDFSVTSLNSTPYLFALDNTLIRKANVSSALAQWSLQVATNISSGHTIFAAPNGIIVVGGNTADNRVAFSIDAGSTFIVTSPFPVPGNTHAIVDYRLQNAFIIYAGSDSNDSDIYALVPGAFPWNPMGAPDNQCYGLAQLNTLYGASSSAIDRTLQPETLGPPTIEWSVFNQGLPAGVMFTREPVSFKASSGVNLWAIDNRPYNYISNTGRLWTFCDCLSPTPQYTPPPPLPKEVLFAKPLPYSPRPDDLVPIYINNNTIADITFQWKHNTAAPAYELWLAKDGDFSQIILQKTINPDNRTAPSWTLTDKKGLEQGKTYYWKVRVIQAVTGEKGTGEWSEALPFTIAKNESAPLSNAGGGVVEPSQPSSENKTTLPTAPASENTTPTQTGLPEKSDLWIWLVIAGLSVILIIIVITGMITSRRKL